MTTLYIVLQLFNTATKTEISWYLAVSVGLSTLAYNCQRFWKDYKRKNQ